MAEGAFVYLASMLTPAEYYRGTIAAHEKDSAKQGWLDDIYQNRIFEVLLDLAQRRGPISGLLVHDAGCGFGNLRQRVLDLGAAYIGTDFLDEMVSGARERHPDGDFRKLDLTKDPLPEADVSILCGTLAYHSAERAVAVLKNTWNHSRVGMVFVSWWDVPTFIDPEKDAWHAQKAIKKFLREIGWNKVIHAKNYGIPYEKAFGVFR